jgi:hypothetical protein
MGAYLFRIDCSACEFQGHLHYGPSYAEYELDDDDSAVVRAEPAWCAGCATIVSAEIMPNVEDIRRELADFECRGAAYTAFLEDVAAFREPIQLVEHHIAGLRSSLKWRMLRQSPSRCLVCGSHDLTYIPWKLGGNQPTIEHPSCGGTLGFVMEAHTVPSRRRYSVEGIRLVP